MYMKIYSENCHETVFSVSVVIVIIIIITRRCFVLGCVFGCKWDKWEFHGSWRTIPSLRAKERKSRLALLAMFQTYQNKCQFVSSKRIAPRWLRHSSRAQLAMSLLQGVHNIPTTKNNRQISLFKQKYNYIARALESLHRPRKLLCFCSAQRTIHTPRHNATNCLSFME